MTNMLIALLYGALVVLSVAAPARSGSSAITRSTVDRPDQLSEWQIHAVYFVPKGSRDARLDSDGTLDAGVRRMQAWFRRASDGYTWRLDTFGPDQTLDVTFVRGNRTNEAYSSGSESVLTAVGDELRRRGMKVAKTHKRYLVFYAGDTQDLGLCGVAEYPIYAPRQYTPAGDPGVLLGGDFAMVFLGADQACHPDDFGRGSTPGWVQTSMMHELIHTEGLAPPGAPHTCDPSFLISAGHVCGLAAASLGVPSVTEPVDPERGDVMFPFVNMPLSEKVLDNGQDDFFATSFGTLDLTRSAFVDGPKGSALMSRSEDRVVAPPTVHIHGDHNSPFTHPNG